MDLIYLYSPVFDFSTRKDTSRDYHHQVSTCNWNSVPRSCVRLIYTGVGNWYTEHRTFKNVKFLKTTSRDTVIQIQLSHFPSIMELDACLVYLLGSSPSLKIISAKYIRYYTKPGDGAKHPLSVLRLKDLSLSPRLSTTGHVRRLILEELRDRDSYYHLNPPSVNLGNLGDFSFSHLELNSRGTIPLKLLSLSLPRGLKTVKLHRVNCQSIDPRVFSGIKKMVVYKVDGVDYDRLREIVGNLEIIEEVVVTPPKEDKRSCVLL